MQDSRIQGCRPSQHDIGDHAGAVPDALVATSPVLHPPGEDCGAEGHQSRDNQNGDDDSDNGSGRQTCAPKYVPDVAGIPQEYLT